MSFLEKGPHITWVTRDIEPDQSLNHPLSWSSEYENEMPDVQWPPRHLRSYSDTLGKLWNRYMDWGDPEPEGPTGE